MEKDIIVRSQPALELIRDSVSDQSDSSTWKSACSKVDCKSGVMEREHAVVGVPFLPGRDLDLIVRITGVAPEHFLY